MSKYWYYKPFSYMEWRPITHGSAEGNRCTLVIGNPLIGHLVILRKRDMCFTYDKESKMGYVSLSTSSEDGVFVIDTKTVAPGVNIDVVRDTGEVLGVEIFGKGA